MKNFKFLFSIPLTLMMSCFISLIIGWEPLNVIGVLLITQGALSALQYFYGPMLPNGLSFMAIVYPTDCDDLTLAHQCSDCDDPELARIRSVAFIHKDFAFSDPTSYTEWFNGIAAGDIIIIPATRGSFDGGTPKEGAGYGDQATKYIGSDYSITFFDPDYKSNRDFYNNLKRFQNYKVAYKTETLIHIVDKVCQVLPKAPVADDITGEVVWEVMVKWSSQNEPTPYTSPAGIFVCFEVE